jgi:heme O synthase-like polyprenyltransferase
MLAVRDTDGRATARQAILYSVLLVGVSALVGAGAIAASAALLAMSIVFAAARTTRNARRLFMTSNLYLVVAMAVLVFG